MNLSAQAHEKFLNKFPHMLVNHLCTSLNLLLRGDFNYHVNKEANVYIKEFFGLLECFGLKNHVEIKTHIKGNNPDLVIRRENELLPMDITTDNSVTYVHVTVIFGIPAPKEHWVQIRPWNVADRNH